MVSYRANINKQHFRSQGYVNQLLSNWHKRLYMSASFTSNDKWKREFNLLNRQQKAWLQKINLVPNWNTVVINLQGLTEDINTMKKAMVSTGILESSQQSSELSIAITNKTSTGNHRNTKKIMSLDKLTKHTRGNNSD